MFEGRLLDRGLPKLDMIAPALRRKLRMQREQAEREALEQAEERLAIAQAERDQARRESMELVKRLMKAERAVERERQAKVLIANEQIPIHANRPAGEIIREVAAHHGYTVATLLGPSRFRSIVVARHHAMAMVHVSRPDLSLPQIGRIFKRDHTTVLHALRKSGVYVTKNPVTIQHGEVR